MFPVYTEFFSSLCSGHLYLHNEKNHKAAYYVGICMVFSRIEPSSKLTFNLPQSLNCVHMPNYLLEQSNNTTSYVCDLDATPKPIIFLFKQETCLIVSQVDSQNEIPITPSNSKSETGASKHSIQYGEGHRRKVC